MNAKIKQVFTGWNIAFLIFLLLFTGYYTVHWKTNEHIIQVNQSSGMVNETVLFYGRNDAVPVNRFRENDKSHWQLEQTIILLAGFLIYMFLSNMKETFGDIIPVDIQQQFVHDRLASKPNIDSFHVHENSPLQLMQADTAAPKPLVRWVYTEIKFKDDQAEEAGANYVGYSLNPFKNEIFDIIKLNEIPNNMVKCPNCGMYPSFKVTTPEGLNELRTKWDAHKYRNL